MTTIHRYLLCLGSNFEAEHHLRFAEKQISGYFSDVRWGKAVATAPEGGTGEVPYLNRAAVVCCALPPESMKAWCKQLEAACGRTPESKSAGIIPLDIDLLSADDTILKPDDMRKEYVKKAIAWLG